MEIARGPLVYRGRKEIGEAVGLPAKSIPHYVEEHDLPAFKPPESGCWVALPSDLLEWLQKQRDRARRNGVSRG